jgi:hypothetical protein
MTYSGTRRVFPHRPAGAIFENNTIGRLKQGGLDVP